jgi:hypothetical protein
MRGMTGSISKYSPSPPHTPPSILCEVDRYSFVATTRTILTDVRPYVNLRRREKEQPDKKSRLFAGAMRKPWLSHPKKISPRSVRGYRVLRRQALKNCLFLSTTIYNYAPLTLGCEDSHKALSFFVVKATSQTKPQIVCRIERSKNARPRQFLAI